jgi:hypothetical protein
LAYRCPMILRRFVLGTRVSLPDLVPLLEW